MSFVVKNPSLGVSKKHGLYRNACGVLRYILALALAMHSSVYLLGEDKRAAAKLDVKEAAKPESPPYRGLDASLYMLTSAEYKACCIQAFRWAAYAAKDKLEARQDKTLPPAVVMDLDETILDNGLFQSNQIRDEVAFDANRWEHWELEGGDKVRLVPGAKKFIDKLRELGIEPVFITNRNNRAREQTLSILNRLEISVPSDQLLCADEATGSNKTSRRELIAKKFDVLVFVGDNLRDFDDRFRYDISAVGDKRGSLVEELSEKFGTEWIILPNPSYGEWTKAFSNTKLDVDLLYK